jgi:hypothetical protein
MLDKDENISMIEDLFKVDGISSLFFYRDLLDPPGIGMTK